MSKKRRFYHISILLLTFEKVIQHLLTAIFFMVDIPGIGRPDIGPTFQLRDTTMAILNAGVCILFVIVLWSRLAGKGWHRSLLVSLALFDILAEIVFHGFFYITVSVIVSIALLVLVKLDSDKSRDVPLSSISQR